MSEAGVDAGAAVTGDGERRERIAAEAAQQLMVLQQTAEQVVELANLAAGGEPVLVRRQPSVLDATFGDLAVMEQQVEHYAAAMALIRQWLLPGDRRTLGAVLKFAPPDVAAQITEHLRGAGLLPGEGGL